MMPGVGFEEMILLVVVAIIVIGPKDLPLMMRKFGQFTGKMRALAFEFKQGFDELGRQAELEELRKEVADLKKSTGLDDLRKDLQTEQAALRRDIATGMSAAPAPVAALPEPAPYAGLSADHPGYDTGADSRVDGTPPSSPVASGDIVVESEAHVIPDDEVRRPMMHPAVKQDTPA